MAEVPRQLLRQIAAVRNKRARFVLDSIAKNGRVTTEEISRAGYEHPPRAVRDARELGFRIETVKVKHSNGRTIAAHVFGESRGADTSKSGRVALPKRKRDEIIAAAGKRCQICGAEHDLQVDHRIPYEVAGESQATETNPCLVLCGSCNRRKSWTCEHCDNWLKSKSPKVCTVCYWASPDAFEHVAGEAQRRVELVWIGGETSTFERIRREAKKNKRTVAEEVHERLKQSLR
jgi:hypothetical protein